MVTRYIHCDLHVSLHSAYTVIYTHGYMVHALWFTCVVTRNIHCDLHAWLPVHTLWFTCVVTRYIHLNEKIWWLYGTYTVSYVLGYTVHTLWFTYLVIWYIHCDLLLGSSLSRIQGNPQDGWRWQERERDQTGVCSRVWPRFIFHRSLYTLSWYISKGQISTQT